MKPAPWQRFLNQANHNQKLADLLEAQGTDEFPDWVITALFYKGLHWLSAWLTQQHCPAAGFASHGATRATIHPNPRTKPNLHIPVSKRAYEAYSELYDLSLTARYAGFLNEPAMREMALLNTRRCKQDLETLRQFIEGKGLKLS